MTKNTLRVLAVLSLAFWVTALFLPTFWIDAGANSAMYDGYAVALLGPLSFMAGVFSWYANLYWAYATIRMAMGHAPNPILVFANSLLAASFVLGFRSVGADEGSTGDALPQLGAWVWLAAFIPGLAVAVATSIQVSRQVMEAK